MTMRFNRRQVLRLLAGTSVGAALPWLSSPSARAQSNGPPLRILFIEAGPGVRRSTFEPVVQGPKMVNATTVVTEWAFRPVMSALDPYRDRAIFFENLDMVSVKEDPSSPANAHIDGQTHMLTATDRYNGTGDLGGGTSIDQLIAQRLGQNGPLTRLPSLEMDVRDDSGFYSRSALRHSYSAPGQKVPFLSYIPDIWDRVFPEPLDPNAGGGEAARNARKTSVYNFVKGDYDRLIGRLGGEDRTKVQQMLDFRSELQSRLTIVNNRELNRPDQSTILDPWSLLDEGYQRGNPSNRTWKVHYELIGKMAAAALHTDTTRVVNVAIDGPPDYESGYVSGSFGSSDAHDLDHKVSGDTPDLTDPAAGAVIDQSHRVTYDAVRYILDELASLQETDGATLLDHTVVVIYSHIAEGSHDVTRLPWVVIGDAHGKLRTGRYVRFPATQNGTVTTDPNVSRVWTARGRAHNDLFVTLAQAMDIPIDSFGRTDFAESHGAITEILA